MRALVLSGGGVKGAYQVGVLKKWMAEDGLDYDIFCGVSVGAINASFLAQFVGGDPKGTWEALNNIWARVNQSNIKKSWFPFGVLEALWKSSVYNSDPLQKWIRSELDPTKIAFSGKKLRVVACSLNEHQTFAATETTPDIVSWVLASSSFPVMLPPVEIDGQLWSDGGLRSVTPLGEAIRLGADVIDIIMCSNPEVVEPWDAKGKAAIPDLLRQTLEIMGDQILLSDLQICGLKNDLVELRPEYKKVQIRLLQPKVSLTSNSLDFDPTAIQKMVQQGYADACVLSSYVPSRSTG